MCQESSNTQRGTTKRGSQCVLATCRVECWEQHNQTIMLIQHASMKAAVSRSDHTAAGARNFNTQSHNRKRVSLPFLIQPASNEIISALALLCETNVCFLHTHPGYWHECLLTEKIKKNNRNSFWILANLLRTMRPERSPSGNPRIYRLQNRIDESLL